MFASTRICVNGTGDQKILTVAFVLAGFFGLSLVMACGHCILINSGASACHCDSRKGVNKTSLAIKALKRAGAYGDAHCINIRSRKGKTRNKISFL